MSGLVAATPPALTPFDPLGDQGRGIAARLQLVFPPSLFQFRYLPSAINAKSWREITSGNQPFLGLGFVNVAPKTESDVFYGVASWLLLCAVRQAAGVPRTLLLGDAQGTGVLKIAGAAAAVLHGAVAGGGTIAVTKIGFAVSEAWGDDQAVMALDLQIPVRLALNDMIDQPDGVGIFEEMLTTWNMPAPAGSADIYTSDWENPND